MNAAVGSTQGWSDEQLDAIAVEGPVDRHLFDSRTLVALDYAEAMTIGDVDDDLFEMVARQFDPDQLVELTMIISWENSSARFNRALRLPSQEFWRR